MAQRMTNGTNGMRLTRVEWVCEQLQSEHNRILCFEVSERKRQKSYVHDHHQGGGQTVGHWKTGNE